MMVTPLLENSNNCRGTFLARVIPTLRKSIMCLPVFFFWNVHGSGNLSDIDEVIQFSDILCVSETWSVKPDWKYLRFLHFETVVSPAVRVFEHGSAKGGLMIVFNPKLYKVYKLINDFNLIFVMIKTHRSCFILGLIYISPDSDFSALFDTLSLTLNALAGKYPDLPLVIGGDFNCRVAALNQMNPSLLSDACVFSAERVSRDVRTSGRGRSLVSIMEACNMILLNGRSASDTPAEFTFHGVQGFSTIDLI